MICEDSLQKKYTELRKLHEMFEEYPVTKNITTNALNYNLGKSKFGIFILAMIETMRRMKTCRSFPRAWKERCSEDPIISVGAATYDLATALSASETPEKVKRFIRKFKNALVVAKIALPDLVKAHRSNGLTESEVESYFEPLVKYKMKLKCKDLIAYISKFSYFYPCGLIHDTACGMLDSLKQAKTPVAVAELKDTLLSSPLAFRNLLKSISELSQTESQSKTDDDGKKPELEVLDTLLVI